MSSAKKKLQLSRGQKPLCVIAFPKNAMNKDGILERFQESNIDVCIVNDRESLFRFITNEETFAVFLDESLVSDPYLAIKEIRSKKSQMEIVFLSSRLTQDMNLRALAAGAKIVLKIPLPPLQLESRARQLLAQFQIEGNIVSAPTQSKPDLNSYSQSTTTKKPLSSKGLLANRVVYNYSELIKNIRLKVKSFDGDIRIVNIPKELFNADIEKQIYGTATDGETKTMQSPNELVRGGLKGLLQTGDQIFSRLSNTYKIDRVYLISIRDKAPFVDSEFPDKLHFLMSSNSEIAKNLTVNSKLFPILQICFERRKPCAYLEESPVMVGNDRRPDSLLLDGKPEKSSAAFPVFVGKDILGMVLVTYSYEEKRLEDPGYLIGLSHMVSKAEILFRKLDFLSRYYRHLGHVKDEQKMDPHQAIAKALKKA